MIFGRWDPIRATLAGLLFGFATNLQSALSIIGSPVPSEFMLMLPYIVTIVAVAGLVGRVRGPARIRKAIHKIMSDVEGGGARRPERACREGGGAPGKHRHQLG